MHNPVPRKHAEPYAPFAWPAGQKIDLKPRDLALELDLAGLLEIRQTRRVFAKPIESTALGEFLWLACRNRCSRPSPYGSDQESRVHPSAGALHPIHVLVASEGNLWMRYSPTEHALTEVLGSAGSATALRTETARLLNVAYGTLIGLVAEPGKTAAKYENHETLVWRDAGVVLGYMSVVAEALDMSFCPLGITGSPHLTNYLSTTELEAVGLAVLGAS